MSTSLTVGKARLSTITLITGGVVDNVTPLTISTGNAATMRVTVNPSNNREVAIVGLATSPGVNVTVSANGHNAASLIVITVDSSPPPPDGPTFGPWSDEIDPPSWA